jgi:hypothetical protein
MSDFYKISPLQRMPKSVFVFRRTAPPHIWRAAAIKLHYVVVVAHVRAACRSYGELRSAAAGAYRHCGSRWPTKRPLKTRLVSRPLPTPFRRAPRSPASNP